MSDHVSYSGRYLWLKNAMAQPKSVLTADTKNVLTALFFSMDTDVDHKTIHYSTLAAATGLSEEGVRGCIKRAKKAGFIRSSGKGGFIRNNGEIKGLASTFWLMTPCGLAKPGEVSTRVDQPDYPVQPTRLPGSANPTTRFGQTANSSLSSSLKPTIPSSSGADALKESPFDAVSLWGEFWPKDAIVVPSINIDAPDRWVQGRLDDVAFSLLGFHSRPSTRTSSEESAWGSINRHLKSMDFTDLIARYRQGTLTTLDIAEALASEKVLPPAVDPAVLKEDEYAKAS